jgi:hypothetical protein
VDYVSFTVRITHVSGDILSIRRKDDDKRKRFSEEVDPHVEVSRLERTAERGDLPPINECEAKVLTLDYELGSGEFVEDHGIVSVGARRPKTVAYKALFTFTGRSGKEGHWTWSPTTYSCYPTLGPQPIRQGETIPDQPIRAESSQPAASPTRRTGAPPSFPFVWANPESSIRCDSRSVASFWAHELFFRQDSCIP